MKSLSRLLISLTLSMTLLACASAPAVKSSALQPPLTPTGTLVGACGDADPTAPCVHEVPQGWTMMTAGTHAAGSDLLMAESVRRSLVVKRHEVTQEEWSWLMDSAPSFFSDCPDCPVERVSWWDALAYLNRLSIADGFQPCYGMSGCSGSPGGGCPDGRPWCESRYSCEAVSYRGEQCTGYRLPTEDEWRWVADATSSRPEVVSFPWCADISRGQPRPVTRTLDGTMDGIAGNVWEWTWSHGDERGRRAHRGGSFRTSPKRCDAGAESAALPEMRSYFVGFRPMRTLPLAVPRGVGGGARDTAAAERRGISTPSPAQ
jgi:hypothetical protein